MARRTPPLDSTGYFHISSRAVYDLPLFRDASEEELFLSLYGRWSSKYGWRTLAWTLLGNHHHFLVRVVDGDLSTGLRVLHSGFARRVNQKYGQTRKGHLVRHCFYAGALTTNDAILSVARYIDLNPVRAGLCDAPEDWPLSSYAATVGVTHARPFHSPSELLRLLSETPKTSRARYRRFIQEGLGESSRVLSSDEGYESVTTARVLESAA